MKLTASGSTPDLAANSRHQPR